MLAYVAQEFCLRGSDLELRERVGGDRAQAAHDGAELVVEVVRLAPSHAPKLAKARAGGNAPVARLTNDARVHHI